jgi:proline iminopeptidase
MKILISLFLVLTTCSMGYAHEAQEVTVQVDEAKLFCRSFGKGDPIIVIHGGPGLDQNYLLPYMVKLADSHRVIFYDQRSCGQSLGEMNENTIQITTYLEDLEAIRKSLGGQQVTVVGHSWGGFLAMNYAIHHPEAIHKLILLNTMPASSGEFLLFLQEWTKRMTPFLGEFTAIQESSELAKGDPLAIEKYYLIMFKRYCFDPEKALLLNVG